MRSTKNSMSFKSGHRPLPPPLLLAAVLIPSAVLIILAAAAAAVPPAYADNHPLTVEISAGTTSPTNMTTIPFGMDFGRSVNATTFNATDISVTSGTVDNLRIVWDLERIFGRSNDFAGVLENDEFGNPHAVAVNGTGHIFVADTNGERIQVFNSTWDFVASIRNTGDIGFSVLTDMVIDDNSGHLYAANLGYVSDTGTVKVFNTARDLVRTIAGFNFPWGMGLDAVSGDLYVIHGSFGAYKISVYNSTWDSKPHISLGGLPDGILPFASVQDVAVDSDSNRIYVTDSRGRVVVLNSTGGYVDQISGLHSTRGVAVDPSMGLLYVAEEGTRYRVQVYNSTTHDHVTTLPGAFNYPRQIALDASGSVYVAVVNNGQIRKFNVGHAFDVVDPLDGRTLTVNMTAGSVQDIDGVGNEASNNASIVIDRTGPTPVITSVQPNATSSPVINFRVDFGQAVTGFAPDEITLSGTGTHGGPANFEERGGGLYTFEVRPTLNGTILVDIAANAARDLAGNPSEAAARFSIIYYSEPLIPTITGIQQGPTGLRTVSFALNFSKPVAASQLDTSDISATSGTVSNMRFAPQHNGSFGGRGSGDDRFTLPSGVAVNGTGHIFVADLGNGRISVFDDTRRQIGGITGLDAPSAVATGDRSGRIFVADDTGGGRVAVFDSAWGRITDLPGTFDSPTGVAVHPSSGRVFVADNTGAGGRVAVFDPSAGLTYAAAPDLPGPFDSPTGVAVHPSSGRVYVTDNTGAGGRVAVFEPSAGRTYAAAPDLPGTFDRPRGVTVDAFSGDVYVADTNNHRILVFNPARSIIANITGLFNLPYHAAVDGSSGTLYVADRNGHHVRVFDPTYAFDVEAPADGYTLVVDMPAGRVQDRNGTPNEASYQERILIDRTPPVPAITATTPGLTNVTTAHLRLDWGESVDARTLAAPDINVTSGTVGLGLELDPAGSFGGRGTADGLFERPTGVAVGSAGSVYVTDESNGVQIFDADLNYTADLPGPFSRPSDVAVDATTGHIYVADLFADRIRVFNSTHHHIANITGAFSNASDVAVDGRSGNTYVADPDADLVRVFDPWRRHAADIDDRFDNPGGVAVDGSTGRIYVADTGNDRVAVFGPDGRFLHNITGWFTGPEDVAVDGISGTVYVADRGGLRVQVFASDTGGNVHNITGISGPVSLAVDGSGTLYVADRSSHMIRTFEPAYRIAVADIGEGILAVNLPAGLVRDGAGNANDASGYAYLEVDHTAPRPVITAVQTSPTDAAVIDLRVNFTEPVTGFEADDIALSGTAPHGGVTGFTKLTPANYTFQIRPTFQGDIHVDIPAGTLRDQAGNLGTAAARFSITSSGTQLIPTVTAVPADPTTLRSVPFSLTFNRAVDPATLDASDIVPSSGTVRNLRLAPQHLTSLEGTGAPGDRFSGPLGMAVDGGSGDIYVADTANGHVDVFDRHGRHVQTMDDHLGSPAGIAINGSGVIFVADSNSGQVDVFGPDRGHTGTVDYPFSFPTDVAVDDLTGTLYVADTGNSLVRMFDSALDHTGDIPRTSFSFPRSVAVNGSGHVFVADSVNNRVAVFGPGLDPLPDLPGTFNNPSGVEVDGSGRIYVSDTGGNRVEIFDPALRSIANMTDGFDAPRSPAIDGYSGRIYVPNWRSGHVAVLDGTAHAFEVADPADGRRLTVSIPEGRVQDPAGNRNVASNEADIGVDRSLSGVVSAAITAPDRITIRYGEPVHAAGTAYGALTVGGAPRGYAAGDPLSGNGTEVHILAFAEGGTASPGAVGTLIINATAITDRVGNVLDDTDAYLQRLADGQPPGIIHAVITTSPDHITVRYGEPVHATGTAYGALAVGGAPRVHDWAARSSGNGTAVHTLAFTGGGVQGAPSSAGTLVMDRTAVTDLAGNALGGTTAHLQALTSGLLPTAGITTNATAPTATPTVHFTVTFNRPVSNATLDISDINATSGTVSNLRPVPHHSFFGSADATSGSGPGEFNTPHGVAVNGSGHIFAADTNNGRISIFNSTGQHLTDIRGLAGPYGVAINGSGHIFVAETNGNRLSVFDSARNPVATITDLLLQPSAVAIDGVSGAVYVTNLGNGRVQIFDHAGRHTGNLTDTFSLPHGVAVHGISGTLYVADSANNDIAVFDSTGGRIATINGTFALPHHLAVDGASGALYVADRDHHHIEVFRITGGPGTAAEIAWNRTAIIEGGFSNPRGVAVHGATGTVYVADSDNHRIAVFDGARYAFGVENATDGRTLAVNLAAGGVQDLAGNAIAGSGTVRVGIDRTAPVPVITAVQDSPTRAPAIDLRVDWGENVTGFGAADIVLSGDATHRGVTDFAAAANGSAYTFKVRPTAGGTIHVDIPAGAAADAAGNPGVEADRLSMVYDGMLLVPGITTPQGHTSLRTVPFALDFNRAIDPSTLDSSDIRATSGTVRDLRLQPQPGGIFGGGGPGEDGQGSGPGHLHSPSGVGRQRLRVRVRGRHKQRPRPDPRPLAGPRGQHHHPACQPLRRGRAPHLGRRIRIRLEHQPRRDLQPGREPQRHPHHHRRVPPSAGSGRQRHRPHLRGRLGALTDLRL